MKIANTTAYDTSDLLNLMERIASSRRTTLVDTLVTVVYSNTSSAWRTGNLNTGNMRLHVVRPNQQILADVDRLAIAALLDHERTSISPRTLANLIDVLSGWTELLEAPDRNLIVVFNGEAPTVRFGPEPDPLLVETTLRMSRLYRARRAVLRADQSVAYNVERLAAAERRLRSAREELLLMEAENHAAGCEPL